MKTVRRALCYLFTVGVLCSGAPLHAADHGAAQSKARATLPTFLTVWQQHPAGVGGYRVLVVVKQGAQSEAIWFDDFKAASAGFQGILRVTPRVIKGLANGQTIPFTAADIVDWSYEDQSAGKLRGNYLQCADLRDLPKAEYEEQLDYLGLICQD